MEHSTTKVPIRTLVVVVVVKEFVSFLLSII